ncbi:NAD(P)-dependent alcohol dehydrogenase [Cerasicoccus fimbriatus]|uniref:NAD(P)-dependent alcohol dehydrogenase n=1 Tax=Cerasicoccus fimbriatus TaxID=3014554 RepID=UPI0022B35705|nr:NAD(P)-dependent alcohol dehydrogenase [Cerasicoccus sp. TK19100]
MYQAKAFSAASATAPLAQDSIPRRDTTDRDVAIDILFCGVCHSDLHQVRNEWESVMPTVYPCVPGHEIIGRVTAVGTGVSKYKIGDLVGVGCMVDADHSCQHDHEHEEQFWPGTAFTYNSPDKHGTAPVTYGGYSESIVVDERFVLKVPENLDPAGAAPLLCAGITTYSPLRRAKVGPGVKMGVVGLGGLGHMAVKLGHAMGAEVTVFTRSKSKVEDAKELGADDVVISTDPEAMKAVAGKFDFILDCVAAEHDLNEYIALLGVNGNLTLVGAPEQPLPIKAFGLLFGNKSISGSIIGGIKQTQEMLDFCGEHSITADVEVIPIQQINEAYERMLKSDVKYRFSIDMNSLKQA